MNAVIDIGNSSAKVGIFNNFDLIEKHSFPDESSLIREGLKDFSPDWLLVSSVKGFEYPFEAIFKSVKKKYFYLTPSLSLPLVNLYKTPQTLGFDRIAAACGAWQKFPHQNSLVVDVGSCLTFESVTARGEYCGGGISPGLNMRFKAIHAFTARLPLLKPSKPEALIGNTTDTCIQSGIIYGMEAEIEGVISRYYEIFKELKVILCGGDTQFFENRLKGPIFAIPELVLHGLNSILISNASHS